MEKTTLNAKDIKSTVVRLIEAGRIDDAIQLFDNRDAEVEVACKEYDP